MSLSFLPGYPSPPHGPLARHLPTLAEGVAAGYVQRYSRPGDLVVDPFGQSPRVAGEAALLGRRVVVASLSPVNRFALRAALTPPAESDLRAALTKLADARTGEERLEQHLRNLYRSTCSECGQPVEVTWFGWERDTARPLEKNYYCPQCAEVRARPVDDADLANATKFQPRGPHYYWALGRAASPEDPDREHVQAAVQAYTPRALYAIFTLVVKMHALDLSAAERNRLAAVCLAAFDDACSLWPLPETPARPKTIHPPARFREYNLWLAMENAVGKVAGGGFAGRIHFLPLSDLLALAPDAGGAICLFDGPARELARALPRGSAALAAFVLPRPLPALWGLSVLWAGWLWGERAAAPIKGVLRRKRFDFHWHAEVLRLALTSLRPALAPEARVIGLTSEYDPGFAEATLTAADQAEYALDGMALRTDTAEAQLIWSTGGRGEPVPAALSRALREAAAAAAAHMLRSNGEPAGWLAAHAAAWSALAGRGWLRAAEFEFDQNPMTALSQAVEAGLLGPGALARLGAARNAPPGEGLWWLREPRGVEAPLSDRVEREVARLLSAGEGVEHQKLDAAACAAFPGLIAPEAGLMRACLESYGQETDEGVWYFRAEDAPEQRSKDWEAVLAALKSLGSRLGYETHTVSGGPHYWRESGEAVYAFVVVATASIGAHLLGGQPRAPRKVLVIPGGRAGLVNYKLKRDPRLGQAAEREGWLILKFRHVRRLASEADIDRERFEALLTLDPVTEKAQAQIPLL